MTSKAVIVCRDCGEPVQREMWFLVCACRVGFVAQWDQCLGEGRFLGRVVEPVAINEPEEVVTP